MNLRFIWSFAKFNGISWLSKSKIWIIAGFITPICLVFMISVLSGGKLLPFAIVGGVIAVISTNTLTMVGQTAMFKLELQLQDLIVATKVSKLDYMLAHGLSNLVYSIPGILLFILLDIIFRIFTIERFAITIAVILLLTLATAGLALFVSSRIKRTINMWAASGVLSALLTILPPTFYSYTVLPKLVLYALLVFPMTPAAMVLQGAYGLAPVNYYAAALLVIEAVFYVGLMQKFVEWGIG